ncbi:hypothetical protein GQ55_2G308400 [Panicum hallii var. hallii]|uniref:Uncharacterized protein n=1 Tax=Panicum hallii var. hallii TaxID=1504633 RepID=A0A2T7EU63_9POAL|nr:hypothetical protein GQ55_2G308400 [Panicum hallii var. hallii]
MLQAVRGSERAGGSCDGLTIPLARLLPLASSEMKPPSAPSGCTSLWPARPARRLAGPVRACSNFSVLFRRLGNSASSSSAPSWSALSRQPPPSRLFFSSASSF